MSVRARVVGVTLSSFVAVAALAACGQQPAEDSGAGGGESASITTSAAPSSTPASSEPAPEKPPAEKPAAPVPEELKFSGTTLDGKAFSGESLAGKAAVLWFWAPWCPNCRAEAPTLAKTAAAHEGVTFVGVAGQDEADAMRGFVADYGVGGFSHLDDSSGAIWQHFGITYQPAYAFVSPDGTVDVVKEQLSEADFAGRVEALTGA